MLLRTAPVVLTLAALLAAQEGTAPASTGAPLPEGAPPTMAVIDRRELSTHAHFLASDELGGRYTTSAGQVRAAEYLAAQWKQLGLKPLGDRRGWFQHWPVERTWLDGSTGLTFGSTRVTQRLAVLPSSPGDKVSLSGRFVFCGNGSPEQVPAGLKGRIPVLLAAKARGQGLTAGMGALQRLEAVARELAGAGAAAGVVCLPDDGHELANALNYQGLMPDHPILKFQGAGRSARPLSIPLLVLPREPSAQLLAHLGLQLGGDGVTGDADARASGRLQILVRHDDKATARNVVGYLEGKGSRREAVLFSAHMDHMGTRLDGDAFNGADDNASGTASLLQIAAAFAAADEPPARSIVFLAVSGEEQGLWGSAWFADHPAWPLDQIVAAINLDMVGRQTQLSPDGVISVTPSRSHGKYSTLVREAHGLAARLGLSFSNGDTYYERSDHYNFAQKGVPVVFFCDGEHADYHQVSDTADKLDYAKAEQIARLAFWLGWQVAQDRGRPRELGVQSDW